jgi:hypothetical protein
MRLIRIQLDRAGQEAVPPPRAHNTCTNILQLFQVVKIKGEYGAVLGENKKGMLGGKPLKAVESCALYLKAFKSFYILYYFFIIVAVYR